MNRIGWIVIVSPNLILSPSRTENRNEFDEWKIEYEFDDRERSTKRLNM